ncbi:MAG: energy transducer TonB [Limisphaerales bacterium]
MTAAVAESGALPEYRLKSDLAVYCLPRAAKDDARKLAWANSIALLFVLVGCLGLRQPVFVLRTVAPPPEPMRAEILPPVETDDKPVETPDEEPEEIALEAVEIPVVVPVLVALPEDVSFAVPVEGYVAIAAEARFVPPPPAIIPKAPPPEAPPQPEFRSIRFGGREFRKQPPPNYPEQFQRSRIGGTVEVLITVSSEGHLSRVEVGRSSGNPGLDRHVIDFIRREWRAEPGGGGHYKIAITFAP